MVRAGLVLLPQTTHLTGSRLPAGLPGKAVLTRIQKGLGSLPVKTIGRLELNGPVGISEAPAQVLSLAGINQKQVAVSAVNQTEAQLGVKFLGQAAPLQKCVGSGSGVQGNADAGTP